MRHSLRETKKMVDDRHPCCSHTGTDLIGPVQVFDLPHIPPVLEVTFIRPRSTPVQGLALACEGGLLEYGGRRDAQMVLWSDESPGPVRVSVAPVWPLPVWGLSVWNVWRAVDGRPVAWKDGGALQVAEVAARTWCLHGRCGTGGASFADVRVRLRTLS